MFSFLLPLLVGIALGSVGANLLRRSLAVRWPKIFGLVLLTVLAIPANACAGDASATETPRHCLKPAGSNVCLEEAPGDSLPYVFSGLALPSASRYEFLIVAKTFLPTATRDSLTLPVTGTTATVVLAKPGSPSVIDSLALTLRYRGCNVVGCGPWSNPSTWKYVRKILPPFPGTPPTVDSSAVIGLIAVPESVSLAAIWRRTPTKTLDTMPAGIGGCKQPANGSLAGCYADREQTSCSLYLTHAGLPNPIRDTVFGVFRYSKQVSYTTPAGATLPLGGIGYTRDGTPVPECAGYLPAVCIVADLADGTKVLTVETWQKPACRRELFRKLPPSYTGQWYLPDTTRAALARTAHFEQAVAVRSRAVNEPAGVGMPGLPGYASRQAGPAYPIGVCQCRDTVELRVGERVQLGVYLRMSDNSLRLFLDPVHVAQATAPGLYTIGASTIWGSTPRVYRILPSLAPLKLAGT